MSRMDAESVYFEPTKVWLLNQPTGEMAAPMGMTIHAKIGARWQRLLLMPDDGESFGAMCERLGQWYADEPETFATKLFEGLDIARSGDAR